MGMWDKVVLGLVDVASKAGQDIARAYVEDRILHGGTKPRSASALLEEPPPPPSSCPYCNIASSLASAHLYLGRAGDRPALADIYRVLAATSVGGALATASALVGSPSRRHMQLIQGLTEMDVRLSSPVRPGDLSLLAARSQALSDLALDMAEYTNVGELEPVVPRVPEGDVIEGEARVIE